jgi:site-specific DNA-methyltransferase (adenine-specific)
MAWSRRLLSRLDLVLAGPPFGETALGWDAVCDDWPALARPLLTASGSAWCSASMRAALRMAAGGAWTGWRFAQEVVWRKQDGTGLLADRFRRVHEEGITNRGRLIMAQRRG